MMYFLGATYILGPLMTVAVMLVILALLSPCFKNVYQLIEYVCLSPVSNVQKVSFKNYKCGYFVGGEISIINQHHSKASQSLVLLSRVYLF